MSIILKPHTPANTQNQFIGEVKDFNVEATQLHGATYIKQHTPEIVDAASPVAEHEAEGKRILIQEQVRQQKEEDQQQFDDLYPSEQRLAIERRYTPLIRKLSNEHVTSCDVVSEFEDSQIRFRSDIQARYAFEGRHPDVRLVHCAGDTHFKQLLSTGELFKDNYKLVDRRHFGGTQYRLVLIPSNIPDLQFYANSDEAKAVSQSEYDIALKRIIQKRKNSAVALTELKQAARDALAAIPSFEDLVSDSVKRAIKKAS